MLRVYEFGSMAEMELFLNGGILGGLVASGISGLVGKELTFSAPAGTVTFTDAGRPNGTLILSDIKAQVEATLSDTNIKVSQMNGKISFVHPTGTAAIALDTDNEDAKRLLGFSAAATTGKVYGTDTSSAPALVSVHSTVDNSFVLVTVE